MPVSVRLCAGHLLGELGMKQVYREMAGIFLSGIVLAFALAFAMGSALLPKLGKGMDIPGTDYGEYQDFAQTKAVCKRRQPKIVRKGSFRCEEGDEILLANMFEGIDAEGNDLGIEVMDVLDEGGISQIKCYHRGGHKLVGLRQGAYLLELRAVDWERKATVKRFALLVEGKKE